MKTMQGPGSSSRLFQSVSSLYLKLSNEGMALINQIEVTTSCGEEYQSDWLIIFASPGCWLGLVSGCHRGDCYLTRAMAAPAPGVITSTPSTLRHRELRVWRVQICGKRQPGLGLIIRAYEISSGTSLITRATIKHRHLFLSSLIHWHLFRKAMNQAAVIKVSNCPVSPQSHGSSRLSQSTSVAAQNKHLKSSKCLASCN